MVAVVLLDVSLFASDSGLHTERSSEYLPAPDELEVVTFGAQPTMITKQNRNNKRWRILLNDYTTVVADVIFNFLVFNVTKHSAVRILDAYFVVSAGDFL